MIPEAASVGDGGLCTWRAAAARGVSFYLDAQGHLRLKHRGLSAEDLAALRRHRARIVAEWLWTRPAPPDRFVWDAAVADAVLAVAVELMAGARLAAADPAALEAAQAAVDAAWRDRDLPAVTRAAQAWTLCVYDRRARADPARDAQEDTQKRKEGL